MFIKYCTAKKKEIFSFFTLLPCYVSPVFIIIFKNSYLLFQMSLITLGIKICLNQYFLKYCSVFMYHMAIL